MKSQDFLFTATRYVYNLPPCKYKEINSSLPYYNYVILINFLSNSYRKKSISTISPILDEKPGFPVYSN